MIQCYASMALECNKIRGLLGADIFVNGGTGATAIDDKFGIMANLGFKYWGAIFVKSEENTHSKMFLDKRHYHHLLNNKYQHLLHSLVCYEKIKVLGINTVLPIETRPQWIISKLTKDTS